MKRKWSCKKLSTERKLELINRYIKGENATSLAKIFGVCQKTACNILEKHNIKRRSISLCHQIYNINETYFDTIDTQEKAYILGLLFSDGNNYPPKNTICLSLKENDRDILEKIKMLIGSNRPLEYIPSKKMKIKGQKEHISGPQYALKICNKRISKKLNELGCVQAKSSILKFPKWLSESLIRHFIRGYFDGDGSIVIYTKDDKLVSATFMITSSAEFCQEIKNILTKILNTGGCIEWPKNSKCNTVRIGGNKQVNKIINWLYQDASIYLERKYIKCHKFLQLYKNQKENILTKKNLV